ncbi:MAG: phospho-N-acetylmuramoyl-pentapeptide-transferase [Chloroflexi bacterium]|nr:phospho-N-acetylmuramoyl-pentapeptide-transferase [Chloroflexota bacterium]
MTMAFSLGLGALACLLSLLLGRPLLSLLRSHAVGKQIRTEGPNSHAGKTGTLTMGGLMIFASVLVITVPFNLVNKLSILLPLATMVACGILGAVDDVLNLANSKTAGIAARFKMAWLLAIAAVAAGVLYFAFNLESINIPFVGKFSIGVWYLPIALLVIVGSANAVNLTDGLDTLAGSTAALAFAAYGIIALLQEQPYLVAFSFTVVGATLGFLWYNAHPAQVFMGDTGSLALGATLGVVALMTGHWLLLPIVGLVFVLETGSVMLQVAYFKLTGGRRIFKMAPLHHHFELSGWTETQVAMRFLLIGMMAAMLGIALALS